MSGSQFPRPIFLFSRRRKKQTRMMRGGDYDRSSLGRCSAKTCDRNVKINCTLNPAGHLNCRLIATIHHQIEVHAVRLRRLCSYGNRSRGSWSLLRHLTFRERSSRLGKPAIRRDEPLDHGYHQLLRFDWILACLQAEDFTIGDQFAMQLGGQFHGELNRFVVRDRSEFQPGHVSLRVARRRDRA